MDKQEYRTRIDEVRKLIREGDKEDAFYIMDGINWRKVHNVNALLSASEIYEKEGHYPQARELLEMAHERSPIGRMIIYKLALLCIRLESYEEAREYYNEFVDIAPNDSLKYIIQYQLAKAGGAEDITLISILEELKEHDFLEEWAYELALLYHKTGQVDKCIAICDQIILYYGDGPYVENAMELKMVHQPLDETQETKYKNFRSRRGGITEVKPGEEFGGNGEILSHPVKIPEVALSNDRFNTQNLQAEIKRNIEEIMRATEENAVSENMEAIKELVDDIPYAKLPRESTGPMEEVSIKKEEAKRIDDTLRSHFREYLEEEYDGQMSFTVPDMYDVEPQIAGQMTIDQIMSDWQRTARAAEQALSEAEALRLENAKAKAIEEANQIIARLEEAKRELDAGVSPRDLLRNEYLADIPSQGEELARRFTALREQLGGSPDPGRSDNAKQEQRLEDTRFVPSGRRTSESKKPTGEDAPDPAIRKYATKRINKPDNKERGALKNQSTFKIPKIEKTTGQKDGVGFEFPIVDYDGKPKIEGEPDRRQREIPRNDQDRQPRAERDNGRRDSHLSEREAARVMADVNDVLQKEIDRAKEHTDVLPRIDTQISSLSPDQTQAFAEAVVRILNEQARLKEGGELSALDAIAKLHETSGNVVKRDEAEEQVKSVVRTGRDTEKVPVRLRNTDSSVRNASAGSVEGAVLPAPSTPIKEAERQGLSATTEAAGLQRPKVPTEAAGPQRPTVPTEAAGLQRPTVPTEASGLQRPTASTEAAGPYEPSVQIKDPEQIIPSVSSAPVIHNVPVEPDVSSISMEPSGSTVSSRNSIPKRHDGMSLVVDRTVSTEADDMAKVEDQEEIRHKKTIFHVDEEPEDDFEEPDDFDSDDRDQSSEDDGNSIYDDIPQTELTEEERELFTYFTPISGMEQALCQVLNGVRARFLSDERVSTGNIIIQGGEGTGKTALATTLITVLQHEVGRPGKNVGRIDGEKLNTKDLSKLFGKIRGGALIIERAGDITRDTALELSAQLEQDESGILVILEDARIGIERVMALNPMFSRRFTEKVVIPMLSIDELVNFGKAYALELGYSIDEMGVLALYDRINLIQRTDHPTNLTEVKEIVDEAIDIAEGGGIRGFLGRFGGRHFDQDGNLILQEKDFQGR